MIKSIKTIIAAPLHLLGKLADVEQTVPTVTDFNVVLVDIAAYPVGTDAILMDNADHVTVRDSEFFRVICGDEADALFSLFQMPVQTVAPVAVYEYIFFPFVGLKTDKIGILLCVRPETIHSAIIKTAFRVFPADAVHNFTAFQKTETQVIAHKGVENIFKFPLKFLGVQALPVAFPCF